jgi:hypothetical protein
MEHTVAADEIKTKTHDCKDQASAGEEKASLLFPPNKILENSKAESRSLELNATWIHEAQNIVPDLAGDFKQEVCDDRVSGSNMDLDSSSDPRCQRSEDMSETAKGHVETKSGDQEVLGFDRKRGFECSHPVFHHEEAPEHSHVLGQNIDADEDGQRCFPGLP